jgi:hypothetical protein
LRDQERRWEFWWPQLEQPDWEVGLEDLPPELFYLPIHPDQRPEMIGEFHLLCGVRTDGYLSLCIFDQRPGEGDAEQAMATRARAAAANTRLRAEVEGGGAIAGHFVRLVVRFDGAAGLGPDPSFERPRLLSQPDPGRMSPLYPPAALEAGVSGSAVVECITPAGTGPLENCTLLSEEPANRGFGPPSVTIAETVVAAPFTINGRPWRQVVQQRISWRVE